MSQPQINQNLSKNIILGIIIFFLGCWLLQYFGEKRQQEQTLLEIKERNDKLISEFCQKQRDIGALRDSDIACQKSTP